ncbi:MAG: insulinase family protein, partial [Pyrinomonadaceae bacterium]|nr:insulinase family protein [Pyrinomonadaceae bacterium]
MRVSSRRAVSAAMLVFMLAFSALAQGNRKSSPKKNTAGKNSARSKVPDTFQLPRAAIEEFKLANGLRIILNRDTSVPVVSVAVYYNVGSRDERKGRTGFAHLFEHMMYQGSENVGKGDYMKAIQNAGGTLNGTTSTERTNYFVTLPSNQLPLALWLESDRMRSLKVTQENLDNQREVVKEEKRQRIDNQAYVPAFLLFTELVFQNFSNAHSTIGSMDDLNAANLADVQDFFRIYYAPNNAVLTIAGDFETKEARSLVEKYFSTIPSQPTPPPPDVTEPVNVTKREEVFVDRFAPAPAFLLAWKVPARRTPDYYALALGGSLLYDGDSSRLYQKLVKGEESVVQIQGGTDERRGPSAFYIFALPKPGNTTQKIRETVMREIQRLATEGPTEEEMNKLHNTLRNDAVRSRQSSLARAQSISEYALYDGDPNFFNTELDRYLKVTPAQIKDAVSRLLVTDNRVLLEIVPAKPKAPAATPAASGEPKQPGATPP